LYVDCTARGLPKQATSRPVFEPGRISLQMVRQLQPTFSAAMVGRIESSGADLAAKNELARVAPMCDDADDFVRSYVPSMENALAWARDSQLRRWLRNCRLNAPANMLLRAPEADAAEQALAARVRDAFPGALANAQRLAGRASPP
jgi:hypothetical protein